MPVVDKFIDCKNLGDKYVDCRKDFILSVYNKQRGQWVREKQGQYPGWK